MVSMPEYAPLYEEPPYQFNDSDVMYIHGRADPDTIKEFLPDPLEYTSNYIRFGVHENHDIEGLAEYKGGTIHIPAKYNEIVGGTLLNEWVDEDEPLAVGRELWGYPKKMGNISMEEKDDKVIGEVTRKGKQIFRATFEPAGSDVQSGNFMPRLQVRKIPAAERVSEPTKQIIKIGEDSEGDVKGHPGLSISSERRGTGTITLGEELEPLNPIEITGATYFNRSFSLDYGEDITGKEQL